MFIYSGVDSCRRDVIVQFCRMTVCHAKKGSDDCCQVRGEFLGGSSRADMPISRWFLALAPPNHPYCLRPGPPYQQFLGLRGRQELGLFEFYQLRPP